MSRLESGSTGSVPGPADGRANERRRAVLDALLAAAAPLALADLAVELVERERGPSPGASDHEAIQRCYVSLYHRHVPKLVDAGLVTFDDDRRTVALPE